MKDKKINSIKEFLTIVFMVFSLVCIIWTMIEFLIYLIKIMSTISIFTMLRYGITLGFLALLIQGNNNVSKVIDKVYSYITNEKPKK